MAYRRFSYNRKGIEDFIENVRSIDGMTWKFFYDCAGPVELKCNTMRSQLPLQHISRLRLETCYPQEVSPHQIMCSDFDEAKCYFTPFAHVLSRTHSENYRVLVYRKAPQPI